MMNPTTDVTEADSATFDTLVGDGAAIVDFWAPWCGPCRTFAPVFAESAVRHATVRHLKVDVDQNPELATRFAIQSIPTLIVFRDGQPIARVSGALGSAQLTELLQSVANQA